MNSWLNGLNICLRLCFVLIFLHVFEFCGLWRWVKLVIVLSAPCTPPMEDSQHTCHEPMDKGGNWPGGRECGCWEAVKKKSCYLQMLLSVSSPQMAIISHFALRYTHFLKIKLAIHTCIKMCGFKSSIICLWPQCLLSVVNTLIGYLLSEKLQFCLFSQSEGSYHSALWNNPLRGLGVYTFGMLPICNHIFKIYCACRCQGETSWKRPWRISDGKGYYL